MAPRWRDVLKQRPTLWCLLVAPLLFFYCATFSLWTDLPIEDDYHGLLGFALAWNSSKGWSQHLLTLLSYQHNEYKLLLINSIIALQLWGTHRLRFGVWMLAGDLLPLLCLYVLWCAMPQDLIAYKRQAAFVPVVWLVLTLNYSEVLNWTMVETQMLTGITLSLCCIYLLTREQPRWNAWAIVLAMGACMANANGFLLAPVGLMLLSRKGKRLLLAPWIASFAIILFLYLFRYHRQAPLGVSSLMKSIAFFFAAMGCSVGYRAFYPPAIVLGFAMVSFFMYAMLRRFDRANPFACWMAVFLMMTFALITVGRAGLGVAGAFASRYRINSDLLLIMLYLLGLSNRERWAGWRRNKAFVLPVLASLCLLISVSGDVLGLRAMLVRRAHLRYGMAHYEVSHGVASPMVYAEHPPAVMVRPAVEEEAREILSNAEAEGWYHVPARY